MKILKILLCTVLSAIFLPLTRTVYAQSVKDSVSVTYIAEMGGKGSKPGEFNDPQAICLSPNGYMYIADTGNQRIQKFDHRGNFITGIGGFGWETDQFDSPVSISAPNGLDVFVADYNNHRIQRYDKDLNFLATFKSSNDWPEHLQFEFPKDMALSPQGELFCLDGENNRVLKLNVYGLPELSFGGFSYGEGSLGEPQRLFISKNGYAFVSDRENSAIFMFD